MLVRVRSKDGIFRFPLEPTDDVAVLIQKVLETAPTADAATLTFSNQPRGGEMDAQGLKGSTLGDLGIGHGHLLYAAYKDSATASTETATEASIPSVQAASSSAGPSSSSSKPPALDKPWETVQLDLVDKFLEKKSGMIPRPRDNKMCRHGEKAMCDYCMPLEPYDAGYQAEHKIKHMSFHAYLKKLDVATNASKPSQTYIPPLEQPNYTVRVPCPSGQHPSWPAGICTKCQPSAITLQSQEYRIVDHVEFAHPSLIENLLSFWRSTATQRYGFLLGHFEPYEEVPMGIKAVVEAIHEPPQEGELDGLTLGVPWEDQQRVEELARACNLQIVGQIYTDLTQADPTFTDPEKAGQVLCKRHKDSFFLSSQEAIFAAQLQAANPNPCKYSRTGQYGSKFVTCVLSGTEDGAIDVSSYQISEQGVGMVKSDMVEASVSPNIVRVKKSEGERYVPEVFYRYKNEYNIEVKESAKPTFPVEYLLATVTHGFPNVPAPRFLSTEPFAVENRPGLHDQTLEKALASITAAVGDYVDLTDTKGKGKASATGDDVAMVRQKLVGALSDWHLLAFLDTTNILDREDMRVICQVATSHDTGEALDSLLSRPNFQNLMTIARSHADEAKANGGRSGGGGGGEVMGDYAGDDYIPPEAMEGYVAPSAQKSSSSTVGTPVTARSTPRAPVSSAPAAPVNLKSGGNHENDDFTYTGDSDEDVDFNDGEEEIGYGEDDDMFDDAASNLSVQEQPPPTTSSNRGTTSQASSRAPPPAPAAAPRAEPAVVACPHCTFENPVGSTDCDVCGLPLSG